MYNKAAERAATQDYNLQNGIKAQSLASLAAVIHDLFHLYNTCGSYWGIPYLLLHKRLTQKNQILVYSFVH